MNKLFVAIFIFQFFFIGCTPIKKNNSSKSYKDIVNESHDNEDVRRRLKAINELGSKSLYPAILSCLAVVANVDDQIKFLQYLLTYFVKHSVIGNKESTVLERVVYGVAQELRRTGNVEDSLTKLIAASPSDQEFKDQFAKTTVRRVASARWVLKELEHYKRLTGEVGVETPSRVHVEHIYPQTPPADRRWDSHEKHIGRLGNLTLLGRKLNISLQNADFVTKKIKYEESDLLLTKELLEYDEWSPQTIEDRQMALSEAAVEIWKYQ